MTDCVVAFLSNHEGKIDQFKISDIEEGDWKTALTLAHKELVNSDSHNTSPEDLDFITARYESFLKYIQSLEDAHSWYANMDGYFSILWL